MAFFLRSLQRPLTNVSRGLLFCQKPTTSYRLMSQKLKPPKTYMTWRSFTVSAVLGGLFVGGMLYVKAEKQRMIDKERTRELGKAKIVGSFSLTDMNGVRKTNEDFKGKWCLIYFGFTHCPDICPDELEKMAKVIDLVKEHKNIDFQALFVSVDPERDTPKAIKEYLSEFHSEIMGLTGTPEELKQTSKSFRVYFSAGPTDQQEDYIVDHTVIMYLLGPEGDFVDYYGLNRTAKMISDGIQFQHAKYTRSKKSILGGLL